MAEFESQVCFLKTLFASKIAKLDPVYTVLLFHNYIAYKNMQAQSHPILKNIIRLLLSISSHICVPFSCSYQFCDVRDGESHDLRSSLFKKRNFHSGS